MEILNLEIDPKDYLVRFSELHGIDAAFRDREIDRVLDELSGHAVRPGACESEASESVANNDLRSSLVEKVVVAALSSRNPVIQTVGSSLAAKWLVDGHSSPNDSEWLTSLSVLLLRVPKAMWLQVIADTAWLFRRAGNSSLDLFRHGNLLKEDAGLEDLDGHQLAVYYLVGLQLARYDFRFGLVLKLAENARIEIPEVLQDARYSQILQAFELFALLAKVAPGSDASRVLRDRVNGFLGLDSHDHVTGSPDPKIVSLVLHGMWFSQGSEFCSAMIAAADWLLLRDSSDWVANLRKASALRRQERFDDALTAIDLAIEYSPTADLESQGQLHRERAAIFHERETLGLFHEQAQRLRDEASEELTEVKAGIAIQAEKFNGQFNGLLFTMLEILGIFTGIIAIAGVAAGGALLGEISWWARIVIIVVGALAIAGFVGIIHLIVRSNRNPVGED